jgi:hypothetical protein
MKKKASLVVFAAALGAAVLAARILLVEFFPGILQAMASVLP